MTVDPVEFGKHAERISMLQSDMSELKVNMAVANAKLDTVLVTLAEKRGERKAIAAIATLAGGLGSFVISLLFKVFAR